MWTVLGLKKFFSQIKKFFFATFSFPHFLIFFCLGIVQEWWILPEIMWKRGILRLLSAPVSKVKSIYKKLVKKEPKKKPENEVYNE